MPFPPEIHPRLNPAIGRLYDDAFETFHGPLQAKSIHTLPPEPRPGPRPQLAAHATPHPGFSMIPTKQFGHIRTHDKGSTNSLIDC